MRSFIDWLNATRIRVFGKSLYDYERVDNPDPKPGETWVFQSYSRRFAAKVAAAGVGLIRVERKSICEWDLYDYSEAVCKLEPKEHQ